MLQYTTQVFNDLGGPMLHDDLKKLNNYPFHMPGHKRNADFGILGSDIDITEIENFDNLHHAESSILEIETKLKNIYGAKKSFMLVNGSTVGILSAVLAVTNKGDKIVIARNCHESVYNACFLNELNVVYIEPKFNTENGFYGKVTQSAVDKVLKENSDAKALVITSPTYEGVISDVTAPVPLIIDSAHGAHFGFSSFPKYPEGDIVVSSLHKTLPALTQTAVINIYNEKFTPRVKKYLSILETSSPSYVLMNSVSKLAEILETKTALFDELSENLKELYATKLNRLKFVVTDDMSKIVVSASVANINGVELSNILRNNYRIECEMASINYVLLMSSIGDKKGAFQNLSNALAQIDSTLKSVPPKAIEKPPLPQKFCETFKEFQTVKTEFSECEGFVSGETVYAYPPDVPIICRGEIFTPSVIRYINECFKNEVNIVSDGNSLPQYVLTKKRD